MPVLCVWLKISFILLLALSDMETATSGPYKSSLISIRDCERPSRPYMKDSPMIFKASLQNTSSITMLSGNFTISKDIRNVKIRLKSMIRENNKLRLTYLINDIGCHSLLLHLISTTSGFKYDRKTCTFFKGQYTIKNFDVNSIQHLFIANSAYGEVIWRSELLNQNAGTFFCYEFDTITEPV